MFAGIIEEKAKVKKIHKGSRGVQITVESKKMAADTIFGDSIAINGVCLTVMKIKGKQMTFDVMAETLRSTTLSRISQGSFVNLERSLKLGDRISGHFVTGHVDCIGKIASVAKRSDDYVMSIELAPEKMAYTAIKGSVAIEGVSLTVAGVKKNCVVVCLIPTTLQETILGSRKAGDGVNVEFDILSKYALKETSHAVSKIDVEFLKEHGFA